MDIVFSEDAGVPAAWPRTACGSSYGGYYRPSVRQGLPAPLARRSLVQFKTNVSFKKRRCDVNTVESYDLLFFFRKALTYMFLKASSSAATTSAISVPGYFGFPDKCRILIRGWIRSSYKGYNQISYVGTKEWHM